MKMYYLFSLMFLCLFLGCEEEDSVCNNDFQEIDGECLNNNDLDVLSDFREYSDEFDDTTPVLDIGLQSWDDGRLTELDFNFYNNQLTSLPENIGNLSSLKILWLGDNQLTSLPESIGNLSSLNRLELNNNQLTTLPDSLCNLPNNCYIIVSNNQLCEEYHYDCIDEWGEQDCGD